MCPDMNPTTRSTASTARGRVLVALIAAVATFVGDGARAQGTAASVGNVMQAEAAKTPVVRIFPTQSYLRLANLGDAPVTHSIEVYGLDSASTLGSVQITVPAKASLQVRPQDMLQTLLPINRDQFMALYIDPSAAKQYVQHVRFDGRTGAFGDATSCLLKSPAAAAPAAALNVHTSRIARYASFVTVHNAGADPIALEARLTDARTGARLGTIAIPLPARGTHSASGIWYQQQGGLFLPAEDQVHFNVEFVPTDGQDTSKLVVGHEVQDLTASSGPINLSTMCAIATEGGA